MYAWGSKPYLNVLFFSFRFGELSLVMSLARFPFFCCLSQFLHLHGGLVLISRLWLKVLGCHGNAHLLFFSPFNYFDIVFLPVLSQFLIFFLFVHWVYLQCFKSNFPRFFFPTPIFFSKMSICLLTFPPKVADFSIYIIDFCIHFVDFPPRFLSSLSKLLITSSCLWPLSGHWSFLLAH